MIYPLHPPTDRRLRIAFVVINHNRREGTSRAIAEVAEHLAVRHEVHVFSSTAENVDLNRVTWHRIPGIRYPHIAEFLSFVLPAHSRIDLGAFDIVHAAGAVLRGADVYGIHNIQPAKRPILARLAREEQVSALRRLTRWLYLTVTSKFEALCFDERWRGKTPLFLAVSSGVLRELCSFNRTGDAPAKVIPNGADLEIFRPRPPAESMAFRAEVGLN